MIKLAVLSEMARRFCRDQRGNMLVMAGFLIVPFVGIVGITVDYSRASNTRQALTAAIDSASLMAARDAQKLSDGELNTRVQNWIRDNLPASTRSEFTGAKLTIDRTTRTIRIAADANVPTTIARVLGTQSIPVGSNSEATWGTNRIELALVLDNTGSMSSSSKMTNLKAASKDLIKIMKEAAIETDQIRVSIVPFNTQVRIPRGFKDAEWIRYGETRTVSCAKVDGKDCTFDGTKLTDTDGVSCTIRNGKVRCTQSLTKASWAMSEGCIADRDKNYDVSDGGAFSNDQKYPAIWCGESSLAETMALTSDWSALETRINAMTPVGNTNVTIGAVWGWATLSTDAPYTEAKLPTEPNLKKYMILLTDGDNTENRFTTTTSEIDARTKLACEGIKKNSINLYTIRVINGNASLLKECASKAEMYYDVQNASQLGPVFKQIANEISEVRLTH